MKLAFRHAVDVLEAPAVAVLYPHERNLHDIAAKPSSTCYSLPVTTGAGYCEVRDLLAGLRAGVRERSPPPRDSVSGRADGMARAFHCVLGRHNHLDDTHGHSKNSHGA